MQSVGSYEARFMVFLFQDVEGYRTSAKEEIGDWLAALKEKDITDWLIIVVMNEESRVKSRLLRNSVFDKVKNDFCSKLPDRYSGFTSQIPF